MWNKTTAGRKRSRKQKAKPQVSAEIEAVIQSVPPPPPLPAKPDRRRENALARLEIDPAQLAAFPRVTHMLDSVGGVDGALTYLRASDSKEAQEVVRLWDLIGPSVRIIIPFEAFVLSAKLTAKQFMQILMGEVCEQSNIASTLLAAASHPDIVRKTIDVAKSDLYGADKARDTLHKNRGFLPTPRTQHVAINTLNQDNSVTQDNRTAHVSISELDFANDKIGRAVDRFNESRALPSAPPVDFLDVESNSPSIIGNTDDSDGNDEAGD